MLGRENLGYELDELLELTPIDIKPEFDQDSFAVMIRQLKTGEVQQLVFRTKHQRKDGSSYDVEVRLQMSQYQSEGAFLAFILDVTDQLRTESHNKQLQEELMDASRKAGMAEVATGVLHNVGNILNSVNVSAAVIRRHYEESALDNLKRITTLITEHESEFVKFVRDDHRGQMLPMYLQGVTDALSDEQQTVDSEFGDLLRNIDHIKDIVSVQQSMAKYSGVKQDLSSQELVQDLIAATKGSLANHRIEISQSIDPSTPNLVSDKHKVLQILINLVSNAKDSVIENHSDAPKINVDVASDDQSIVFRVSDNGLGIAPDKLNEVFQHGFTTKRNGHGFGLHSCANAASELGGKLTASSDGVGCGATFELSIPVSASAAQSKQQTHPQASSIL